MEKLICILKERLGAFVLLVAVAGAVVLPTLSMATIGDLSDDELGLDILRRRGGGEGDPLDTNDAGGSDGDSDVNNPVSSIRTGSGGFLSLFSAGRVLVVPQFDGRSLIFSIVILPDDNSVDWWRSAK